MIVRMLHAHRRRGLHAGRWRDREGPNRYSVVPEISSADRSINAKRIGTLPLLAASDFLVGQSLSISCHYYVVVSALHFRPIRSRLERKVKDS